MMKTIRLYRVNTYSNYCITITLTGSDNEFYQGASWIESEFGLSDEFFAPLEQRVADLGAGDQQRVAPKVQKTHHEIQIWFNEWCSLINELLEPVKEII